MGIAHPRSVVPGRAAYETPQVASVRSRMRLTMFTFCGFQHLIRGVVFPESNVRFPPTPDTSS